MDIPLILYIFVCITVSFIKGLVGWRSPAVHAAAVGSSCPTAPSPRDKLPVSCAQCPAVWKNAPTSPRLVLPIAAFVMLGIIPGTLLLRYGSSVLKLLLGLVIIAMGAGRC